MRTTVSRSTCVAAVAAVLTATSLTGCYSGGGWSMPRLSNLNPMNWGKSSAGSSLAQNGPEYPPSPNIDVPPSQPGGQLAGGSSYGTTSPYGSSPTYPNSGAPGYPNQPASAFESSPPPSHAGGGAQNGFYTADQRNAGGYCAPATNGYNATPPSGGASNYGTPYPPSGGAPTNPYTPPSAGSTTPAPSGGYGGYQGGGSSSYGGAGYDEGSYDTGTYDAGSSSYGGGASGYDPASGGGTSGYGGGSYDDGASGAYPTSGSTPAPGFGSNDSGADSGSYASNDASNMNMSMPNSLMQREGSYAPGSVNRSHLASASSGSPTTFSHTESGDSPADLPSSGYGGGSYPQPGFTMPNRY